ncbi:hypothetical protein GYMLUDRAFT_43957 [Collybiopsis luxurians FD-317 M1]|uniref:Uncharacterized protein n=1 Tax=Collybiopsis luxurians FD-317 M1 TaxID=944289 RepID=A0A0D0CVY3_9AGAR|nr:hypothetical protein GYMLUDRAFT_43957 [Collybiopsis luxurians FD-317 M1]
MLPIRRGWLLHRFRGITSQVQLQQYDEGFEREIIEAYLALDKDGPPCSTSSVQQASFCFLPFGLGPAKTDLNEKWAPFFKGSAHGILRTVIPGALQAFTSLKMGAHIIRVLSDVIRALKPFHHSGMVHGEITLSTILFRWECSKRIRGFLHDFDRSTVMDRIIHTQISTIICQLDPDGTSLVMAGFYKVLSESTLTEAEMEASDAENEDVVMDERLVHSMVRGATFCLDSGSPA